MLQVYQDSPLFYTNAELSATDINILRDNAMIIQGLAKRPAPVHSIHTGLTGFNLNERVWRGGFQYRIGMTEAQIVLVANVGGSPPSPPTAQFSIYMNGVPAHIRQIQTETVTILIDVASRGFSDYEIVTVDCVLEGTGYDPTPDTFYINSAQVSSLSDVISTSYPGTSTFGTLTATRLNDLSNSLDWLAERLSLIPFYPFMMLRNWQGTHYIQTKHIWKGTVYLDDVNTSVFVHMDFTSRADATNVVIVVNGVTFTYGPYGPNHTEDLQIIINLIDEAGCTVGNEYHIDIYEDLTDEIDDYTQRKNSRLNLRDVYMTTSTSNVYVSPPVESQMLESMTFSALQTRLNTIKAMIDDAKSHTDDQPYVFDTVKMFRARYGNNEFQQEYWEDEHVAHGKRKGNVLWVKGRGLSIGWGSVTVSTKGDEEDYQVDYQYSESLTNGDQIESKFYYFDQFEALYPGVDYYIYGKDIIYVGEFLR